MFASIWMVAEVARDNTVELAGRRRPELLAQSRLVDPIQLELGP